ncbi:hypothetical protein PACTADRAFT_52469, partial [Pachysolen tannophilus NRRL Y-2460]
MSLTPAEKAISGALSSVIANTVVYPLDLVKTIIQTQEKHKSKEGNDSAATKEEYDNALDCLIKLYKKKGITGLYSGIEASLMGTAFQNFCYFYWYSVVRNVYNDLIVNRGVINKKKIGPRESKIVNELLLGVIAASISQVFVTPINVISTSQQTNSNELTKEELRDGILSLWNGLKVSLVLSLNPSITYGSYERLKHLLYGSHVEYLKPIQSFTLGLLSKILATLITQPLIVSKATLQSSQYGHKYHSFQDVLVHLYKENGLLGLWRGILPQISKAALVQGLLFMFKDQFDILFIFILKL